MRLSRRAKPLGDQDLSARILNTLGNLFAAQGNHEEALQAYRESASFAPARAAPRLRLLSTVLRIFQPGDYGEARSRIEKALTLLQGLEDSYYKAHALINAGLLCGDLLTHLPDQTAPLAALASDAFAQAVQVSQRIGDLRTLSYALRVPRRPL